LGKVWACAAPRDISAATARTPSETPNIAKDVRSARSDVSLPRGDFCGRITSGFPEIRRPYRASG
jgi:hypothetical protein